MTNTNMLKQQLKNSGYKLSFIVKRLNISRQGFLNKLNNKSYFKQNEIKILADLLELDAETLEQIFFAENVDNISTEEV